MTRQLLSHLQDLALLCGAAMFFFGCIGTAHRGPRALAPGQVSVAGSYMRVSSTKDPGSEPVQLVTVDARAGVGGGVDLGIAHTSDISSGTDGTYSTFWGDVRVQVSNRDNRPGVPTLSLGLLKGYVYHQDAKTHITSLPLMVGVPVNERVTPFLLYRYERLSDSFLSGWDSFEQPRHAVLIGTEVLLGEASKGFVPRIGFGLGWMSSLTGSSEDDPLLLVNLGFGVDSRRRVP